MSASELTALLLKELLSEEVDSLESKYYEQILKLIKELEEKSELRGEAAILRNTLRYLFLYRLEKEIRHIRKHGARPAVELPLEEAQILGCIEEALRKLTGEENIEASIEKEALLEEPEEKGRVPLVEPPRRGRYEGVIAVFLQPHPRIMDKGVSLGPFSKGDIAYLPRRIAKELEEKGVVEVLGEE